MCPSAIPPLTWRRVRREDLNDSESEVEQDEGVRARLEAKIARSLGFGASDGLSFNFVPTMHSVSETAPKTRKEDRFKSPPQTSDESETEVEEDAALEEYDFYLFGGSAPTKVVLDDEKELEGEGGLQPRPLSLSSQTKATGKKLHQLEFAAMTGDDVLAQSQQRFYAMECPWRVTHITMLKKGTRPTIGDLEVNKRTKPNKKKRIATRTKARANESKAEAEKKQAAAKEEQIAEKKKRLNRLKKLRRRAQVKEKKQAGKGGDGGDDGVDGQSDNSE